MVKYILTLFLVTNLYAQNLPDSLYQNITDNKYPIKINEPLHDGDTYKADIIIPEFDLTINHQTLRADNFDTCEVDRTRRSVTISDNELKIGAQARDYVIALFNKYNIYVSPSGKRDVYGRMLVRILISNQNDVANKNKFIDLKDLILFNHFDRSQLNEK